MLGQRGLTAGKRSGLSDSTGVKGQAGRGYGRRGDPREDRGVSVRDPLSVVKITLCSLVDVLEFQTNGSVHTHTIPLI